MASGPISSVAQSCPTLWDSMDCSTPGHPVPFHLLEFTQVHVYWISGAIQPSHPLLVIRSHHFVANRWRNNRNSDRLYFGGSKVTTDGDCSHEIKRYLVLGRKAMTTIDSILKSKHITLLTNICLVKSIAFPVVIYGCESWTIKKAESQWTDVFELWCWRRLLRVSWIART